MCQRSIISQKHPTGTLRLLWSRCLRPTYKTTGRVKADINVIILFSPNPDRVEIHLWHLHRDLLKACWVLHTFTTQHYLHRCSINKPAQWPCGLTTKGTRLTRRRRRVRWLAEWVPVWAATRHSDAPRWCDRHSRSGSSRETPAIFSGLVWACARAEVAVEASESVSRVPEDLFVDIRGFSSFTAVKSRCVHQTSAAARYEQIDVA